MYQHILVPVDGSELSDHAARSAIQLAATLGARISVLHVQPDYPQPIVGEGALIAPESRDDFMRGTARTAERILARIAQAASEAGVAAQTYTEVSDVPWELIVQHAKDKACDLIFMASHGRRGLAGLLIGSETHKVLTHTTIPVLVFREA